MPRPKAVRNKHIFDPEHGGGRIRRNKHLPKRKFYEENSDKIGDRLNFHARIGLDLLQDSPDKELRTNCDDIQSNQYRGLFIQKQDSSEIPFEIAQCEEYEEDEEMPQATENDIDVPYQIKESLYYNQDGQAEYIKTEATADEPLPFNKISVDQVYDLIG